MISSSQKKYPFFLGSTSYVYHADILTNVTRLAPLVDDIELVIFTADEENNLPSRDLLQTIDKIAGEKGCGFTIHLPLHLFFGARNDEFRQSSIILAADTINCTRSLDPRGYVLHLNGPVTDRQCEEADWNTWIERCCSSLDEISSRSVPLSYICIENLEGYDITRLCSVLDAIDVSLCLDIGHLWLQEKDPVPFIETYGERIKIVHLHGINKRDHSSLIHADKNEVYRVLDALKAHSFSGVLTLEVFSTGDLFTSIEVVEMWAAGRSGVS
jgi:sugar phosphate isomerase/epimerase